jgi:2-succinyl-6-hydroxy-2,4-cyclohexadiene-1-carboxylate synthase
MTSPFELHAGQKGPPLVLLHGFLGRPSMWMETLNALGPHGPVALASLPGHGPAPWTPAQDTFESAVDGLMAAIPFTEQSWLVAYSLGARLALWMLLREPDRFAGAILVGGNPGLRSAAERQQRVQADDDDAEHILGAGLESFVDRWEKRPLFESQALLPPRVRDLHRHRRLDHTPEGAAWAMRALGLGRMPSAWTLLQEASVPMRIVAGERDGKFSALGNEIRMTTLNATFRAIPGAGHDVALENPVALAREIRTALADATSPTRRN